MKKPIESFEDIQLLVRSFYNKVLADQMLGPFFTYVRYNHWEEHLETVDRFWNNILFYSGGYQGNPMETHNTLHHFALLEKKHFDQWLRYFNETVDESFVGEKAELAKQRAYSIAIIMQIKILGDKEVNNPSKN